MNKILMILIGSVITVSFTVGLTGQAFAGTRDPRVNHREHNQHQRIVQGVKSGELTHTEAKDLRGDQKNIHQEEKAFKSDGKLSKDERQELHQDQSAANKEINQEKHDAEQRP